MSEELVWYLDKDEELDFSLTWADWLPIGDSIASSTWVVPAGITKINDSFSSPVTIIWLKDGGELGTRHILQNRIVTTQGRKTERTVVVIMREK